MAKRLVVEADRFEALLSTVGNLSDAVLRMTQWREKVAAGEHDDDANAPDWKKLESDAAGCYAVPADALRDAAEANHTLFMSALLGGMVVREVSR